MEKLNHLFVLENEVSHTMTITLFTIDSVYRMLEARVVKSETMTGIAFHGPCRVAYQPDNIFDETIHITVNKQDNALMIEHKEYQYCFDRLGNSTVNEDGSPFLNLRNLNCELVVNHNLLLKIINPRKERGTGEEKCVIS